MTESESFIRVCGHCLNKTPHNLLESYSNMKVFDVIEDREIPELFLYTSLECQTCKCISLVGGFQLEMENNIRDHPLLYPQLNSFSKGVPKSIRYIYEEARPIIQDSPGAFVGQIRKALEVLCKDQNAGGNDLFEQLKDLTNKGILPKTMSDMSDLIRKTGNIGVHANDKKIDVWDAELIDNFFRLVVEYVYEAPQKIDRLIERLESQL